MKKNTIRLKKIVIASFVLGLTNMAIAGMLESVTSVTEPAPSMATLKSGFYAGLGVGGYSVQNEWVNNGGTYVPISNLFTIVFDNTLTVNGGDIALDGTGFVGYSWHLPKRLFLGIEGFGNLTNATTSGTDVAVAGIEDVNFEGFTGNVDVNLDSVIDLTIQNVYGIRALPGYMINDSAVVYGIFGLARAHAKSNASYSTTLVGEVEGTPFEMPWGGSSVSHAYDFNGYQLGIGSMIAVSEHFSIRGDIIYTNYGTETLNSGLDEDSDGSVNYITVTSNPTTLEANVSLVYMFD